MNELEETGGRSSFRILLDQFTNIMLLMLIAVAIISGVLSVRAHEVSKDAIAVRSNSQMTFQISLSDYGSISAYTLSEMAVSRRPIWTFQRLA